MKKITIITLSILVLVSFLGLTAIGASAKGNKFYSSMMGMGYYKNFGQMMNEMKGKIFNGFAKHSNIVGQVSSTGSSTLKITVKDKEYMVNVDIANDILVNRLWDKINLGDIKVGDTVQVFGTKTNSTIDAKLIRDISIPIQTEINITGTVTSVSSGTLNVKTYNNTEYIVNVEAGDIIVNRIWDKISLSDIKVGDKLMVIGQTTGSTTINAKLIKDLSLPQTPVVIEEDDED